MSSNHCNNNIFCIQEFVDQIEKLRKNNSYRDLDKELIDFLKDRNIDFFRTGTRLNQSDIVPYVKHDIKGRGGYRLYYLAFIFKECVYIGFIHPKTGKHGFGNTTQEARSTFYKRITECIKTKELYKVKLDSEVLVFEKV